MGRSRRTGSTKKLTSYSRALAGLADGVHVFAVTFTLTDGGTATASVEFTIDTPTLEETCTDLLGGTVTYNPSPGVTWRCLADPYLGPFFTVVPFSPFCPSNLLVGGPGLSESGAITATVNCFD